MVSDALSQSIPCFHAFNQTYFSIDGASSSNVMDSSSIG